MNRVRTVTMLYFYYYIFVFNEIYLRHAGRHAGRQKTEHIHSLSLSLLLYDFCMLFRTLHHILKCWLFYHSLFINVSLCASLRLFYCYCHLPFAIPLLQFVLLFVHSTLLICVHGAAMNFWARIKYTNPSHTRTTIYTNEMKVYICANVFCFVFYFYFYFLRSCSFAQHIYYLFLFMLWIFASFLI